MQVIYYIIESKLDKQGNAPIFYSITFGGERIRRKIKGVKVMPKDWNGNLQRVKPPLKKEPYNYHIEYNKTIEELDQKLKTIFRLILLNEIVPTKDYILDKLDDKSPVEITHNFIDSFQEFIDTSKITKAERTIKSYVTALNVFKDFSERKKYPLRFDTINKEFFAKFQEFCFVEKKTKNNYFSRLITTLKTFMRWAMENDYHENLDFLKFQAPEEEIEVIYLTLDELMKLYHHDFEKEKLSRVRDVYCFGCFTGLRFSDLKNLRPSNIMENEIKLNIQKTRTIDHRIPLNEYAKSILQRYRDTIWEPLPIISPQKFNSYVKECCRLAGIDTPTSITRYRGTKRLDKTVPKYELITSHTARKTFVTNSLVLGMKEMVVRNITGHKKEETFRRYVKIAENLKQEEMSKAWNNI
ncbi:tyrosine-type recombinase/integrase [Maribacter aurantiacus]|uniref:Site-specific integrase n=1 Tax=Maribacter aurantiacus TaxID=1882343 RepID=A0A5R8M420_9FLAO|nr:site-specific integrase [Maribacter aurantiacus]TLF43179.1 site-specific integrase [Maribacter aurantiacus]